MRVLSLVAGVCLLVAGCSAAKASAAVLDVSTSHCGQGWTGAHAGQQTLQVRNSGDTAAEAYVVGVPGGAVFGELENVAPGTTRDMPVTLGGGTFALKCVPDGADPILGPRVTIKGAPVRGLAPVTYGDLYGPVKSYQAYVSTGLAGLAAKTAVLKERVDAGDLSGARGAWLDAHLAYERLGAAYDAFGDLGDAIDGDSSGFHLLEHGLWHGADAAALSRAAAALDDDVRRLQARFPTMQVDPADLGLRAHEILEGTLRFELSGETDQGSGTSLATADANVDGTRAVLTVLRPLLTSRYAGLAGVDAGLSRLSALLRAQDRGGAWTPVERLSTADREHIDAAADDVLERLAPVAAICAPRHVE